MSKATKSKRPAAEQPPSRGLLARAIATVAAALVALAVALSPFGLSQDTDLPLLSLALTALLAALLFGSAPARRAIANWRLAWAGLAVLAWALVATIVTGRPAGALIGVPGSGLGWLTVASVGVIVVYSAVAGRAFRPVLMAVAPWVLLVEGALAVWQRSSGRHPAGTLSNSSYLGLVVVALAPLVAFSAVRSDRPTWLRLANGTALAAGLAALVLGDARAALAAAVAGAVGIGAAVFASRAGWKVGAAATAGFGAAVGATALVLAAGRLVARPAIDAFLTDRGRIWAPALRGIAARPVFGFGPDGYASASYRFAGAGGSVAKFSADAHNLLLMVAVSTGAIGLALFLWFAFEVVRNWYRQFNADQAVAFGPFALGVLLYGMVSMTTPAALQTLPLLALLIGTSLRVEVTSRSRLKLPDWSGRALWIASLVVALLTLSAAITRLSLGRTDRPGTSSPKVSNMLAHIWVVDPYLYYRASVDWAYAEARAPGSVSGRQDLVAIRRAVQLEPSNPVYQTELARTLAYYGEPESAVRAAFQRALQLFPASPAAHAAYAEYLISKGQTQAAGTLVEQGLRFSSDPEILRAAYEYFSRSGDTTRAAEYLRRLQSGQ